MRWIKEPLSPTYYLLIDNKKVAYIKSFGLGWYSGTYKRRHGQSASLTNAKFNIYFDLFGISYIIH